MTLPRHETAAIPQPRSGAHDDHPQHTGTLDVLVSVGTDKHHFDRLLGWVEQWWLRQPVRPRLVVQHGSSRPPLIPGATPFLAHDQLGAAMAQARVVVTHGGPASITEARRHGHLPIVVARDPAYGEHVDNHQMLFASRMAASGVIRLCSSARELELALRDGLSGFPAHVTTAPAAAQMAAVHRVGQIVDGLLADKRRRRK
ncbi:glycosyltransferase [Actinoplanes sp. RD1]|uniref:glycosyltransferase n=1 Tax=Actinoplanes sp. RD1 TaxID=3064538 RepID=UPI0027404A92|nr:glycosyltransferase [Actinoplanes sp. RD1]